MKTKLLIITMLVVQISALSQPCLPDGITFTTQAQIDNFQINFPNCTEIEGDVYIWGDDIINVDGLNILTSIGGNLGIGFDEGGGSGNPILNSLEGFGNLITIEGDLGFFGYDGLENLSGDDLVEFYVDCNHIAKYWIFDDEGQNMNLTAVDISTLKGIY